MKDSPVIYPQGFEARLLMIKGFIDRLVSLFTITQQDLKDAGVYLRQERD